MLLYWNGPSVRAQGHPPGDEPMQHNHDIDPPPDPPTPTIDPRPPAPAYANPDEPMAPPDLAMPQFPDQDDPQIALGPPPPPGPPGPPGAGEAEQQDVQLEPPDVSVHGSDDQEEEPPEDVYLPAPLIHSRPATPDLQQSPKKVRIVPPNTPPGSPRKWDKKRGPPSPASTTSSSSGSDRPHPQASSSGINRSPTLPTRDDSDPAQAAVPIVDTEGEQTAPGHDDEETRYYPSDNEDEDDVDALFIDEHPDVWDKLSAEQKYASNTASFTAVFCQDDPVDVFTLGTHQCLLASSMAASTPRTRAQQNRARKEATATDLRNFAKQFAEAKKAEYESWRQNQVFELVDMRKTHPRNYVTGRWVLTIKRNHDGSFQKCKARWVLRGFQDKQRYDQQTDSPTATRPGFRLSCQLAASNGWSVSHVDLKTAFLQGEEYDAVRDVVCQLPPEVGLPSYMGARLKKPAYGMNDAPRRWWNRIDSSLHEYGMVPTRADRCTYVLYADNKADKQKSGATHSRGSTTQGKPPKRPSNTNSDVTVDDDILEYLLDPVTGSPAKGRRAIGVVALHVDDLFMTGTAEFEKLVLQQIRKDYQIGSEDKDDVVFTGQRVRWQGAVLTVDQDKAIEELAEIQVPKGLKDETMCTPAQHTEYRSLLGSLNWLQSRTQFHIAYKFSRSAAQAAAPTIGDVRVLNKVARTVRAQPMKLQFWPLKGNLRIVGYPDASYRNNSDNSSQRGQVVFLAEPRVSGKMNGKGSLVDYESTKIKRTTLSTTVAELYSFMKCFGTCQFLRGLWMDVSGQSAEIHMRTDANNLVTTASTTHLPEQKETIHMIQMLRKEACSGAIDDLAHIRTEFCLSDCLTKHSAKPENLIQAIETGQLPEVDKHPSFRSLIQHRAYLSEWIMENLKFPTQIFTFLATPVGNDTYLTRTSGKVCTRDFWKRTGKILTRVHVQPRRSLFVPGPTCPVPIATLLPSRETVVVQQDMKPSLFSDAWNDSNSARCLTHSWTGETRFVVS